MLALGTEVKIGHQILAIDLRLAGLALEPQPRRAVVTIASRGAFTPKPAL
jgi:hypothetical protein